MNNPKESQPKPSLEPKTVAESKTTMTEIVMPNDTNPLGNLMGGNLMRWMDIVSSICAAKHSKSLVVTVSVDNISFNTPIHLGEVVTLHAQITRAFNTSMEIFVEVFAQSLTGENIRKSNQAYFTFVAIDKETGRPKPVPPVIPLTEEEQKRYESALRRRELRLLLSGKLKPNQATEMIEFFKNIS